MSEAYNSKLISKLYQEDDEEKIIEILEEMDIIGDAYFLRPIYDKYKEKENSSISHYFLGSIAKFKSEEAKDMAQKIALDLQTSKKNFIWCLDYLAEINFFDERITDRAKNILAVFNENGDEYDLDSILSYLSEAKALLDQAEKIKEIFEGEKFSLKVRKKALYYFLRTSPKESFQYYFDNYEKIKDDEVAENIFANEIKDWSGRLVTEFKQKIIREGGSRAKEIIGDYINAEKKKELKNEEKIEKEITIKYSNAPLVMEIFQLRENINNKALSKWGFKLFPQSEAFYKHIEAPQQKATLIAYSNDLRSLLNVIDSKCSYENLVEAQKIIPWLKNNADLKKPLNQLQLYLQSQGRSTDKDVFGLRNLYKILSLIAHPELDKTFFEELKKIDLIDSWNLEDWNKIYIKFLDIYKTALEKLNTLLTD